MMSAFRAPSFETNCFDTLFETVSDPGSEAPVSEPAVAVLDLELCHVACSKSYAALVGEDETRVALHVGMVRRDDATPRGVVVVAHPVPVLSSG